MPAEALTPKALRALTPRKAAAYFVSRRPDGLTRAEQRLLDDWLAAEPSHREALTNAEAAWKAFDDSGDDEILRALRAEAIAPRSRPRRGPG